ncbi:YdiK family protein [Salirhabdus sp. Marseille-P4669]|uniref:YdiK family protein n=1 Tax=Salirhabdus sp. Marseille-P4669 TaxID=2042310 RepID=UPI000C7BA95F|nr:YdiK family protein [Salirhabdus sp. Marseille-P4669]
MRASPLSMAILYFLMGSGFTYIAVQSVEDTVWNLTTIILALVATLDFAAAIRLLTVHVKLKNSKKK